MNLAINFLFCLAFGFLPGKEVKNEKVGNLGLQDRKFIAPSSQSIHSHASRTSRLEVGADIYPRVWR
jgi:hypothetical protein